MNFKDRQAALVRANHDKRRLIVFSLAALLVAAVYVGSLVAGNEAEQSRVKPYSMADQQEVPAETLSVPDIDGAALDALVEDATAEDRVVLERKALDAALAIVRTLQDRHFEALGARALDGALAAELLASPSAHRGQPFFARGWVEELQERGPGYAEYRGRLLLEDGVTSIWFVTPRMRGDGGAVGDFVRLDGLFLAAFLDEVGDRWVDGPLLVGNGLRRSYPKQEAMTAELVASALEQVEDDGMGGISPLPATARWRLLGYARDVPEGDVDWSEVPELDNLALKEILRDGEAYRGEPFRIPISQIMGLSVLRAKENPLRAEKLSEGWIGNTTWVDVIQFEAPFAVDPRIQEGQLAYGTGFFLRNTGYEPVEGGMRIAPKFVLSSLTWFERPEDHTMAALGVVVAGIVLFGIFALWFLVSRDQRRSRELQEELVRRQRARRERAQATSPAVQPN